MRRSDQLLKTMSALRRCLDECLQDASPLATLDKYLKELRQNPDWTDAEIAEMEATARRAIESAAWTKPVASGRPSATMARVHF
jgi:hypothetical protein